jgi:hypothetical protein
MFRIYNSLDDNMVQNINGFVPRNQGFESRSGYWQWADPPSHIESYRMSHGIVKQKSNR